FKSMPSVKFTFWHELGLDNYSFDLFERIAIKNTPCIIGNAVNCLDIIKREYKMPSNKMFILPQYVSIQKKTMNREVVRGKYGIGKDSLVIGMIAHYRPDKLHFLLLNVFSQLSI